MDISVVPETWTNNGPVLFHDPCPAEQQSFRGSRNLFQLLGKAEQNRFRQGKISDFQCRHGSRKVEERIIGMMSAGQMFNHLPLYQLRYCRTILSQTEITQPKQFRMGRRSRGTHMQHVLKFRKILVRQWQKASHVQFRNAGKQIHGRVSACSGVCRTISDHCDQGCGTVFNQMLLLHPLPCPVRHLLGFFRTFHVITKQGIQFQNMVEGQTLPAGNEDFLQRITEFRCQNKAPAGSPFKKPHVDFAEDCLVREKFAAVVQFQHFPERYGGFGSHAEMICQIFHKPVSHWPGFSQPPNKAQRNIALSPRNKGPVHPRPPQQANVRKSHLLQLPDQMLLRRQNRIKKSSVQNGPPRIEMRIQ